MSFENRPHLLSASWSGRRRFGAVAAFVVALLLAPAVAHSADSGGKSLKIVSFGTSLSARGDWQEPLRVRLADCLGRPVSIAVVAKSGATSDWALTALDRVAAERPDAVLVEFYANDAALNRLIGVGRSRRNMAAILDGLRARLPDSRIVVMAMNPLSGLRGWLRPFAERYIASHRQEAEKRHMEFIDLRSAWRRTYGDALREAIPDGLHPLPGKAGAAIVSPLAEKLTDGACPA